MRIQEEFNPVKSPKTFEYVLKNDTVNRRCNACNSVVLKETHVEGYPYQCMNCDVNLYEIETHIGKEHSDKEFDELCCDVRDLLLLDEEI